MLTEVVTTTKVSMEDTQRMAFVGMNKKQDLVAHISIPPPHVDVKTIEALDFQMEEVIFGKLTKDIVKALTTLGIK